MGYQRPLSDLIREGAKMRPHARDWMFDGKGTCALGAAAEAAGAMTIGGNEPFLYSLDERFSAQVMGSGIAGRVAQMNDLGGFTREEIADWLVESGNDILVDCKRIPADDVVEVARERELVRA